MVAKLASSSISTGNVLDEMNEEGQEFEPRAEDEMLSLDLAEVSQVSVCTASLRDCYMKRKC